MKIVFFSIVMSVKVICGLTVTKTMEKTVRIKQFVKKEKRRFLPCCYSGVQITVWRVLLWIRRSINEGSREVTTTLSLSKHVFKPKKSCTIDLSLSNPRRFVSREEYFNRYTFSVPYSSPHLTIPTLPDTFTQSNLNIHILFCSV